MPFIRENISSTKEEIPVGTEVILGGGSVDAFEEVGTSNLIPHNMPYQWKITVDSVVLPSSYGLDRPPCTVSVSNL